MHNLCKTSIKNDNVFPGIFDNGTSFALKLNTIRNRDSIFFAIFTSFQVLFQKLFLGRCLKICYINNLERVLVSYEEFSAIFLWGFITIAYLKLVSPLESLCQSWHSKILWFISQEGGGGDEEVGRVDLHDDQLFRVRRWVRWWRGWKSDLHDDQLSEELPAPRRTRRSGEGKGPYKEM